MQLFFKNLYVQKPLRYLKMKKGKSVTVSKVGSYLYKKEGDFVHTHPPGSLHMNLIIGVTFGAGVGDRKAI